MCANYKAISTLENPDYQDQFLTIFYDDYDDDFQADESSFHYPNTFDEIREYQRLKKENDPKNCKSKILEVISNLKVETNSIEYTTKTLESLKTLEKIFKSEINENIDDFLEETEIVPFLFGFVDFTNCCSSSTEVSIYALNIIVHIARISPKSVENLLLEITENTFPIVDPKSDNGIPNPFFELLKNPNLSPRIIAIIFFSIDSSPQIVENLVLKNNIIARLAYVTRYFKKFGYNFPKFIDPLTTLINILFSFISIDKTIEIKESGKVEVVYKNIIISYEDQEISFPVEEREQEVIIKMIIQLQKLINRIPKEVKGKLYAEVYASTLSPLLDILSKYLECFATKANIYDIMKKVEDILFSFFMTPLNYDQSGKIFNQVLTIYDKILRIDPSFFISSEKYKFKIAQKLFEHVVEYKEQRLEILFFLSNFVKFDEEAQNIISQKWITNYEFLDILNDFNYYEKENAYIVLLNLILKDPVKVYEEVSEENFYEIIYESADLSLSATNDYFIRMFLYVLQFLLDNFGKLLENIDTENIVDCLNMLEEDDQKQDVVHLAKTLKEQYFNENDV